MGYDKNAVAGHDFIIPPGNDGLPGPADSGHHKPVNTANLSQFPQGQVAYRAFFTDAVTEKLNLSLDEFGA